MSFLNNIKKLFKIGHDSEQAKKGQWNVNIKKDQDPLQNWEIITEIGEGAFGAVYKVCYHYLHCFLDVMLPHGHICY